MDIKLKLDTFLKTAKRFRTPIVSGAAFVLIISLILGVLVISGKTRKDQQVAVAAEEAPVSSVVADTHDVRRLDGLLVEPGMDALAPYGVMIENHPDARPLSGLSQARVVMEAPVEGGITRFIAFFDPGASISKIGPVRSARPYYVEWADGWNAPYFYVGGSPEALALIPSISDFTDVNQFAYGNYFWRNQNRYAPHNVYTSSELMASVVEKKGATSTTMPIAWHFQDAATTTDRGDVNHIFVLYGGSFNVAWNYDKELGMYDRSQAGRLQKDLDGTQVEAENVIVIKTDAEVVDSYGRLHLRTTGSGEAIAYRDGNRFVIRWTRSPGEPMRFETTSGAEYLLSRGRTWIEVTTDDAIFSQAK